MSELIKRFFTSIILISLLFLSIVNIYVLTTLLIIIFYQIIYEFYFLLKKNIKFDEKFKLYLLIVLTLIYIGYFNIKIFIIFLNNNSSELLLLYFIITTCIFSDIGGYVFGKIFRGKKLTKISPNKTYSGLIGSFILSLIFTIIFFKNYLDLEKIILMTFVISSVSQIGDIFISYIKRKAKVKNTGNILPGHGGILDRLDGLIFALPFGLFLFKII
ncbi:MAG: phosphatidate cytidylyltransferase [Pseudomonadota bacterium]|nr:phosphatidate cytidylyltransferase [Pseudomonadota bacterium]